MTGIDLVESRFEIVRQHAQKGLYRFHRRGSAGVFPECLLDPRGPLLDPGGGIGQDIVLVDVVVMDAHDLVCQGRQQPGPVLARGAVDHHRPFGGCHGLEVAAVEIEMSRLEGNAAIFLDHEPAHGGGGQLIVGDKGHVRRDTHIADVIVDHPRGEGGRPTGGFPLPLALAAQIDDGGEAQTGHLLKVRVRGSGVVRGAIQDAAGQAGPMVRRIIPVVPEIVDALEG